MLCYVMKNSFIERSSSIRKDLPEKIFTKKIWWRKLVPDLYTIFWENLSTKQISETKIQIDKPQSIAHSLFCIKNTFKKRPCFHYSISNNIFESTIVDICANWKWSILSETCTMYHTYVNNFSIFFLLSNNLGSLLLILLS